MGTCSENDLRFTTGALASLTEKGDPERMMPFRPGSNSKPLEKGRISQKTLASRTALAISWVYCDPKSRIRIFSIMRAKLGKPVCSFEFAVWSLEFHIIKSANSTGL